MSESNVRSIQQSQNLRANIVLILLGLFFAFVLGAAYVLPRVPPQSTASPRIRSTIAPLHSDEVRLQGFPGNGSVQMFDRLAVDAQVIAEIPDGTICSKLGPKLNGSVYDVEMYFYQLDCNGTIGFVNVRWTR